MGKNQTQSEPKLEKAGIVKEISLIGVTTELAIKLAIPVIVLSLAGRWMDRILDTGIIFLVGGTVLGISIATFLAVQRVLGLIKQADREYEEQKKARKRENLPKEEEDEQTLI